MGLFDKFFGKSKSEKDPLKGKPPIYGGDGTSENDLAIVNCASMSLANRLMNNFIAENHGKFETDWNRTIEFFLKSENNKAQKIRVIGIECSNGSAYKYYFDVSRPMAVADKFLGLD